MQPLIGITPSPSLDDMGGQIVYRYVLSRTYVDAVRAAGAIPVVLPTDRAEIDELLTRLDGILLSGGGDIDPALYGDDHVHPQTYGIDHERDAFEMLVFRAAVGRDIPTLCICRGIQSMAVAMGGTLIQDIPSETGGAVEHRQQLLGKTRDDLSHDITITERNPLHEIAGTTRLQVNSYHHQGVRDPGQDLVVVATADDGVIEALWHPGMRFGLGVQWHPEMLDGHVPSQAAIFETFVDAVRSEMAIP